MKEAGASGAAARNACWVLVGVFSALRLVACFNDLWLDEIWALSLVQDLSSPLAILTELRTDNHPLYSLYLWALGPSAPDWAYRLASWLAGTASLVVVASLAGRQVERDPRGSPTEVRLAVAFSLALVGSSSLLVQFDSEARGYALAIAFALLATHVLVARDARGLDRHTAAYWGACALALLAHPIAIHALAGAAAWSLVHRLRVAPSPRRALVDVACWQGPPTTIAVLYYLAYLRALASGGGPELPPLFVAAHVSSLALGLPAEWAEQFGLPAALLLSAVGCALLARRGDDLWILYAVTIWLSPLLVIALSERPLHYHRYFLVSTVFGLLLLARLLAGLWETRRGARVLIVVLLTGVLGGNLYRVAELLVHGRGAYRDVLRYALEQSEPGPVTLSSDHDFRNGKLIAYHRRRIPSGWRLRYVPAEARTPEGPDWLVLHRFELTSMPSARVRDQHGNEYALERVSLHAGVSGWHWLLYRNVAR